MVSTENANSFFLYYLKRNLRFAYFLNNHGGLKAIFPCVFHGFTNGSVIEIIFIKKFEDDFSAVYYQHLKLTVI